MSSKLPPKNDAQQRLNLVNALVPTSILEKSAARLLGRPCRVTGVNFRAAADHVTGFLGDHFRVTLRVTPQDNNAEDQTLHLFVKTSSLLNKDKATFIDTGNFFRRERLVFSLFDDLGGGDADGDAAWHVEGLYHSDDVLIMRDMTSLEYSTQLVSIPYDRAHLLQGVAAIARFHASFANYTMDKSVSGQPYDPRQTCACVCGSITNDPRQACACGSITNDPRQACACGSIISECNFLDCAWLRTAAKLNADMTRELSDVYNDLPNLQDDLTRLYISSCDSLQAYDDTLNVLIHKDTWANNILFRHDNGQPVHAVIIDYQCIRYAPPAFDIMIYLYLNTTKNTRQQYENEIIGHYYDTFCRHLKDNTKNWLKNINYDFKCVQNWCEKARMFGMVLALGIFPYILMDGETAKMFDDPATFVSLCDVDRSVPVIEYGRKHTAYRDRQMDVLHEFIQRYLHK